MKIITSRTNQEIIALASLKKKITRDQEQRFIAEGVRVCTTLINHGIKPICFYVTEPLYNQAKQIAPHITITLVSPAVMEKISSHTTPSGLCGLFNIPPTPNPNTLTTGLVLANITDPGNMGTLIRSAAATGVRSVIVVEGVDPWNPKVVQASAGTIGAVSLFQWSWDMLLAHKKEKILYALIVTGGNTMTSIMPNNALLVIGNEAHGIPKQWLNTCDKQVTIPMPGGTESLNAAVAGSLALYLAFVRH